MSRSACMEAQLICTFALFAAKSRFSHEAVILETVLCKIVPFCVFVNIFKRILVLHFECLNNLIPLFPNFEAHANLYSRVKYVELNLVG